MANNGGYIVDHLQRDEKTQNKYWKYLCQPDIHLVEDEQILKTEVKGDWTHWFKKSKVSSSQ